MSYGGVEVSLDETVIAAMLFCLFENDNN